MSSQAVLWIVRVDDTAPVALTKLGSSTRRTYGADLSPDGKFIAFRVSRDVRSDICIIDANGGYPWQVVSAISSPTGPYFSPDGRAVYWIGRAPAGNDCLLRTALSDT